MAVARLELTPSMPIFDKMVVNAANTEDPNARISFELRKENTTWYILMSSQFQLNNIIYISLYFIKSITFLIEYIKIKSKAYALPLNLNFNI